MDVSRAAPPVVELPKHYALTGAFMQMRVCERFAQDPFGSWWDGLRPGERGMLIAYERLRMAGVGDGG